MKQHCKKQLKYRKYSKVQQSSMVVLKEIEGYDTRTSSSAAAGAAGACTDHTTTLALLFLLLTLCFKSHGNTYEFALYNHMLDIGRSQNEEQLRFN